MTLLAALLLLVPAAQEVDATQVRSPSGQPSGTSTLEDSDRTFLITNQAANLPAMSFRFGTMDQLRTVQGRGNGYYADIFADFAPLSWLTVGGAASYGNIGEREGEAEVAPTFYAKAQFLDQARAGVNMAAALQYKQVGFGPLAGEGEAELEAMLLADRRFGRLAVTANLVYGSSFEGEESDGEIKAGVGYFLEPNLLVGIDALARYDLSRNRPNDGTRSWELTGGPMATLKLGHFTVAALAGISAPMHVPSPAVGVAGMVQIGYRL